MRQGMINRFKQFISEKSLFRPEEKILLAVSGGVDSMVMWELFEECGYNYAVIHCNFRLRGHDSVADEELVTRMAEARGVKLFVRKFDTREYATLEGISVEMAARELRYQWFEEVRKSENFHFIATAHHSDDLIETFFINLVRKTGIKGLTGFRHKSGHIIRPVFFSNRHEIEEFAQKNNIEYRTDITNNEVIFQRNFIRHRIIPELSKLNPAFRNNLVTTMSNLRETEDFYMTEVNRQIKKITNHENTNPEISISALLKLPHPLQILFEWMSRYGFNPSTVDQVFAGLQGEPGRKYFSASHRLVIARNRLIITPVNSVENKLYYIEKDDIDISDPLHITITRTDNINLKIDPDPRQAFLDADKLEFPLILRKWEGGEYFQPFGMTGFKKISDFFTDLKLSIPEKEETWILFSVDKVVWIIGYRIDNRFRITRETKNVAHITLHLD